MVRLVDPQRLNGDPFRLAVPLLAEIIPGGIGIRRDRTAPGIDFDHAEARTDTRGRCGRKYPTLGRNADTDQPEIIFNAFTVSRGGPTLPGFWAAAGAATSAQATARIRSGTSAALIFVTAANAA